MTSLKEWIDTKVESGYIDYFEYNDFNNIETIGKGGFGIVKRADWVDGGGIKVALKGLVNNSIIDENQKKNFLKEVLKILNTC